MSKSLQQFMTSMQKKGVRTQNLFQLEIITGYSDVDKSLEDFTIWAETAEVPGRQQEFAEIPYQGYPFQIPTKMTMTQDHSFTVRSDAYGDIRKAFLKWMSYVSDPAIGEGSKLGGDKRIPVTASIRMFMMDSNMEDILETYKLVGCAVMEVGTLGMTNADVAIATFDVQIKSQYWELQDNVGEFKDLF